jgi:hypothetical protein
VTTAMAIQARERARKELVECGQVLTCHAAISEIRRFAPEKKGP